MTKREILEFLEPIGMDEDVYLSNSEIFYDGWWLSNITGAITVCGNKEGEPYNNLPVLVYTDREMVKDKFLCKEGEGLLSEVYDDGSLLVEEFDEYGKSEDR